MAWSHYTGYVIISNGIHKPGNYIITAGPLLKGISDVSIYESGTSLAKCYGVSACFSNAAYLLYGNIHVNRC